MKQTEYTRKQGLKHTYIIDYDTMSYSIWLGEKRLRQNAVPPFRLATVIGDSARENICLSFAESDIEGLVGMDEEQGTHP